MQSSTGNLATTLLTGVAAGALATVVMGGVTSLLYAYEDQEARKREDSVREDKSAYEIAASRAADAFGLSPSDDQVARAGTAMHYAIGAGSAAIYGLVRPYLPTSPPVKGLAMGATLWLAADEGAVPALGLTKGPLAFPWQAHARGLIGHLTFGLVTEAVFAASDRIKKAAR